mmetsp:Transcript_36276/g.55732  ORF Transcript_36276/g.55732 Transcript_36276/m.55732 type:complete len:286 (+) Transcript_36276:248-1105(+)
MYVLMMVFLFLCSSQVLRREGLATGILLYKLDDIKNNNNNSPTQPQQRRRRSSKSPVRWMIEVNVKDVADDLPPHQDSSEEEEGSTMTTETIKKKEEISELALGKIISRSPTSASTKVARSNKDRTTTMNHKGKEMKEAKRVVETREIIITKTAVLTATTPTTMTNSRSDVKRKEGGSFDESGDKSSIVVNTNKRTTRANTRRVVGTGSPLDGVVVVGGNKTNITRKRKAINHSTITTNKRKNAKKQKKDGGSSPVVLVEKIKLLTGTLVLYRGERRRAEFIRSV